MCFLSFFLSQRPPIKSDCRFDSRNLTAQVDRLKLFRLKQWTSNIERPTSNDECCCRFAPQFEKSTVNCEPIYGMQHGFKMHFFLTVFRLITWAIIFIINRFFQERQEIYPCPSNPHRGNFDICKAPLLFCNPPQILFQIIEWTDHPC